MIHIHGESQQVGYKGGVTSGAFTNENVALCYVFFEIVINVKSLKIFDKERKLTVCHTPLES